MKSEILEALRETDGYVSGQDLCNKFGVSRTAVWKAIKQLKEAGYEIEAVPNKGYHIVSAPDLMNKVELESIRNTTWAGQEIYYYDVTDSTNIRAKELAEEGHPSGTLVVADRQEAGRGRRGRSWDSVEAGDEPESCIHAYACSGDGGCKSNLQMCQHGSTY